jgi:drug/metabolite transporter (DMT)-like permease
MYKLRGILALIAAATFFGIMPIWVKLAYTTGLTALDVNFLRSGTAVVILGIIILYRKTSIRIKRQQLLPLLSGALCYTGTILSLYLSYNYVTAGVATSLHYLFPVLVMLGALFIFHEKLQALKWCALIISLFGIYLIADTAGSSFSFPGVVLAIVSAVLFAIYVLSINHPALNGVGSLVLAFYTYLMAAGICLTLDVAQGDWPFHLTLKGLYYTGLVSFFCTVLALILFIKGVKIIGSSNASIISTLEPVVSLVAGIIILQEPLNLHTSLGCALIIAAVMLISYSDLHDIRHSR